MRILLLIILGFLWSARLAAIKAAALSGIALHVTLSVAVIGIVLIFSGASLWRRSFPPVDRRSVGFYAISGVFGFILPFFLENLVSPHLEVFLFVVIISLMPIMTVLLALVFGLERPRRRQVIAIGLGFLTAVLVALDMEAPDATGVEGNRLFWIVAAFAVPLIYALNTLFVATRWPPGPDAIHVAQAQAAIVGVAALVAGVATNGVAEWGTATQNLPAILAIILCEAFALLLYLRITRDFGASFVAQANYASMVFAALLGFALFGDRLGWMTVLAGVVLIVSLRLNQAGAKPSL